MQLETTFHLSSGLVISATIYDDISPVDAPACALLRSFLAEIADDGRFVIQRARCATVIGGDLVLIAGGAPIGEFVVELAQIAASTASHPEIDWTKCRSSDHQTAPTVRELKCSSHKESHLPSGDGSRITPSSCSRGHRRESSTTRTACRGGTTRLVADTGRAVVGSDPRPSLCRHDDGRGQSHDVSGAGALGVLGRGCACPNQRRCGGTARGSDRGYLGMLTQREGTQPCAAREDVDDARIRQAIEDATEAYGVLAAE